MIKNKKLSLARVQDCQFLNKKYCFWGHNPNMHRSWRVCGSQDLHLHLPCLHAPLMPVRLTFFFFNITREMVYFSVLISRLFFF